jgi:hypothetical protein
MRIAGEWIGVTGNKMGGQESVRDIMSSELPACREKPQSDPIVVWPALYEPLHSSAQDLQTYPAGRATF